MKRTEIDYIVEGDLIQITDIKNVATLNEIEDHFGASILKMYKEGKPRYFEMKYDPGRVKVYVPQSTLPIRFHIGSVFSKDKFTQLIKMMKESGERLGKIKMLVEKTRSKQKTIKI